MYKKKIKNKATINKDDNVNENENENENDK